MFCLCLSPSIRNFSRHLLDALFAPVIGKRFQDAQ
jgi:hypothetical protein